MRAENQDHFLVSTVHPQVVVHGTSLPSLEGLPLRGTRLATVLVLADGVNGAEAGSDAARLATEAVMRYVASTLRSYHAAGDGSDEEFLETDLTTLLTSDERYMVHWYRSQGPGMPPRYYPVSEGASDDEAVDVAIERWERKYSRKYSARS